MTRWNGAVKTNTSFEVRYADGKGGRFLLSEGMIDYVLQRFTEKHGDIVVGYDREAKTLYQQKDMAGLKEYARQQRMRAPL